MTPQTVFVDRSASPQSLHRPVLQELHRSVHSLRFSAVGGLGGVAWRFQLLHLLDWLPANDAKARKSQVAPETSKATKKMSPWAASVFCVEATVNSSWTETMIFIIYISTFQKRPPRINNTEGEEKQTMNSKNNYYQPINLSKTENNNHLPPNINSKAKATSF